MDSADTKWVLSNLTNLLHFRQAKSERSPHKLRALDEPSKFDANRPDLAIFLLVRLPPLPRRKTQNDAAMLLGWAAFGNASPPPPSPLAASSPPPTTTTVYELPL